MLLLKHIKNAKREQLVNELVIEFVGGAEAAQMLVSHQVERLSIRRIAFETGRSPSTVHRAIRTAKERLASKGLLPKGW